MKMTMVVVVVVVISTNWMNVMKLKIMKLKHN